MHVDRAEHSELERVSSPKFPDAGGYFMRNRTYWLRWRGDIRATFFSADVTFFALI
jgi:hypothetical protein